MTRRAGIYVRISVSRDDDDRPRNEDDDRQREVSLGVQEKQARAECEKRGWEVVDVYEDRGISAFKRVERPAYERLLRDVEAGRIDAVVVFKLDRFARSVREFVRYMDVFREHGTAFASVHDPIDTTTATGRAFLGTMTTFAELESENTSLRRREMSLERAKGGEVTKGGKRPFGYRADRVTVHDGEATLIREAADRFLDGQSLRSIAMDWNERGIVTTTGGRWSGHTIAQCLRNPRLAGYRTHHGTPYKSDVIGAIFDEGEHVRLAAALGDAKRRAPRKTVARHLLSSLLFCQLCGKSMKIRGEDWSTNKLRYACVKREDADNCGSVTILAAETEHQVFDDVLGMIDSGELVRVGDDVDVATLIEATEDALREDQAHLERLSMDYVGSDGLRLSRDEYMAARVPLTERVAQHERDLAGLRRRAATRTSAIPSDPDELRAWWADADLQDKRAFLETVLLGVIVYPVRRRGHNRFDPDRLFPVWRR